MSRPTSYLRLLCPFPSLPSEIHRTSMAAATSFSQIFAQCSAKSLKHTPKVPLRSNLGFNSSSSRSLWALTAGAASNGAGALGATMVSAPASIKPLPVLDFETSVFKKEKVTLAGHSEVPD